MKKLGNLYFVFKFYNILDYQKSSQNQCDSKK